MHVVVPFGFYGAGNIGDEATLQGFARLVRQCDQRVSASIGSRNPAHTAAVEPAFSYFRPTGHDPRRWWAKLRATLHAFVGGTPIMDALGDWPLCELVPLVKSAQRHKCPAVFIGAGIESLEHAQSRRIVAEELAPRVRHWSVRSDRDRQRLVEYGVPNEAITVAADLAWLIEPATENFGREKLRRWGLAPSRPIVGVNLVNERLLFERLPRLAGEIAAALDKLVESRDAQIVMLCNEVRGEASFDASAAALVLDKMRRGEAAILAPSEYLPPQNMMSIINCCELTISMRYHFCLFSAVQGVPFVGITRSDKVADLCWDLNWAAALAPAEVTAGGLVELSQLAEKQAALADSVATLRRRARLNLAALNAVTGGELVGEESLVA